MKKILPLFVILTIIFSSCSRKEEVLDYVDPFIGTGGHGHTFPGATLPFGMVQLSPDTRKDSWDGCSGYHYSDSTIMGFSHTHLSGTGVGDYGDIRFMPTTGRLQLDPGTESNPASGYRSRFSHEQESASPGFYSVKLLDYDIDVNLTVSKRVGFHQYNFPKTDTANVIIDLFEGVTSDEIEFLEVEFVNDHAVQGIRKTDGWADDQRVFFYAEFSEPFDDFGVKKNNTFRKTRDKVYGDKIKAFVRYYHDVPDKLMVKVGVSFVDVKGAKQNLETEIPGWNFRHVKKEARKTWAKKLNKIRVKGDKERMKVFYTALYHSYIAPNLFQDVDGRYRGHDGKIHTNTKFNMYTVFSLWDTFRAEHPLMTILEPDITNDFIRSMLDQYEKGGLLPVWELAGNETNCMIGYHSVPVIVDAYMKNIRDYNVRAAFDASRKSAMQDQFGLKHYKKYGYIPADQEGESVSKTLEYAYDDWCIALMAKDMGFKNLYEKYIERAQYYKNIFDPETGFMRGKRNGMFITPFDPTEVNFTLTEANTWQYNFFVPQDISGLMKLYGGKPAFIEKLDAMFNASTDLSGRHQSDITGLIGQYAHGNEPSHHMAYLYDYAGQPWKTQEMVQKICNEQYTAETDGLCGNEDCGQMSAWYVLSAMGFYQVAPGKPEYAIGTPQFEKVSIQLENGNEFVIQAENLSKEDFYIQSAKLNGKDYNKCFLTHDDITKDGDLVFVMGKTAEKNWGTGEGNEPLTSIEDQLITAVPYFEAPSHAFGRELEVTMKSLPEDVIIYYTSDGSLPAENSMVYRDPISINTTTTFRAFAKKAGLAPSKVVEATFTKIPEGRKVYIQNPYSPQYTGGGDVALIDGIHGDSDFRSFGWQGYHGVDFEVVVDLGKKQRVKSAGAEFMQEERSWIFLPERMHVYLSKNGQDYRHAGTIENAVSLRAPGRIIEAFIVKNINKRARYVKVLAENIGACPDWHPGAGNKAWIFVDEVMVD
ncbi:MAG: GH92 family glycosyl hydrolase [Bacteroidales bacterium]|nr:GH92 family glycosyl hydrolase [Bacteroidales bacterium]MCF8388390.1 GH92 family glycosyl hydrolase [Bacteroidales bacterium]MCF8397957.1 GH92 family glycosyl hydrolase [Bacteroidales bacterium]